MAIKKFSVGDKVKLKSGGPAMTVHSYDLDYSFLLKKDVSPDVICSWIDKEGKPHKQKFNEEELEYA